MRVRTRVMAALLATTMTVTLAACGDNSEENASNAQTVPPATAAVSPRGTAQPVGAVEPQGPASALAVSGATTAVLGVDGHSVTLHSGVGAADAPGPKVVQLPMSDVVALIADGDGFLGVGPDGLIAIAADGAVTQWRQLIDSPLSLAVTGDKTLVGTSTGKILVFPADRKAPSKTIGGFVRVDQILVAPDTSPDVAGQVSVLDRAQSAILPVDIDSGEHKAALRAGNGGTNGVVDHFGRILVTGTRDNEIYAYYGAPIVQRLRRPVAASPYALAYDDRRDLLWVSSTSSNEAVAYDLSRGDAKERARIATVGQVSAMAVDPVTGRLLLVSARGDGLQSVPAELTP
ncbi:YncE family protein [Gordonia spumicola]|nr:hypothetical protein [Gordonia spumicola]